MRPLDNGMGITVKPSLNRTWSEESDQDTTHSPTDTAHTSQASSDTPTEGHCRLVASQAELVQVGRHTAADVITHLEKLVGKFSSTTVLTPESAPYGINTSHGGVRIILELPAPSRQVYQLPAAGGVFSFKQTRFPPQENFSSYVAFPEERPSSPRAVMLGIKRLDFSKYTKKSLDKRVEASVNEINKYMFQGNVSASGGAPLDGIEYTWFVPPQPFYSDGDDGRCMGDIEIGTLGTTEFYSWKDPRKDVEKYITFSQPYPTDGPPPSVVVWLTSFHLSPDKNHRINTTAKQISHTGFLLTINTWWDTIMYSATVSWLSHPTDAPGILSGSLSSERGRVAFPEEKFRWGKASKVLLGLSTIDVEWSKEFKIELNQEAVTSGGMGWKVDYWGDTVLHGAKGMFIALE